MTRRLIGFRALPEILRIPGVLESELGSRLLARYLDEHPVGPGAPPAISVRRAWLPTPPDPETRWASPLFSVEPQPGTAVLAQFELSIDADERCFGRIAIAPPADRLGAGWPWVDRYICTDPWAGRLELGFVDGAGVGRVELATELGEDTQQLVVWARLGCGTHEEVAVALVRAIGDHLAVRALSAADLELLRAGGLSDELLALGTWEALVR
jgi:hypothetical protein